MNLSLGFRTPEEYFLGAEAEPFSLGPFEPRHWSRGGDSIWQDHILLSKLKRLPSALVFLRPPESAEADRFLEFFGSQGYTILSDEACRNVQTLNWEPTPNIEGKILLNVSQPVRRARRSILEGYLCALENFSCLWLDRTFEQCCHMEDWRNMSTPTSGPNDLSKDYITVKARKDRLQAWFSMFEVPIKDEGYLEIWSPPLKVSQPLNTSNNSTSLKLYSSTGRG